MKTRGGGKKRVLFSSLHETYYPKSMDMFKQREARKLSWQRQRLYLKHRKQKKSSESSKKSVKRKKNEKKESIVEEWIWQYKDHGWKNYDETASQIVESIYTEWKKKPDLKVREVKSGSWHYEVDFNLLQQRNVAHSAHTVRKIRRIQKK